MATCDLFSLENTGFNKVYVFSIISGFLFENFLIHVFMCLIINHFSLISNLWFVVLNFEVCCDDILL